MKNKTLKLISKALLVIILATSVLSLSSCKLIGFLFYTNVDFSIMEYKEYESFEEMEAYALKMLESYEFNYITFDLSSEESVLKSIYYFNYITGRKNHVEQMPRIVHGQFYFASDDEGIKFIVIYKINTKDIDISDNANFEIRPLYSEYSIANDIERLTEFYGQNHLAPDTEYYKYDFVIKKYLNSGCYGLYADGQIIAPIVIEVISHEYENQSEEKINYEDECYEDEYYDEYYQKICDILLKNLVIIK